MRILIVEDELENALGLKRFILQLDCDDQVYTAANGCEALDLMRRERRFDMAFAAVRMPVLDGLEFLQEARFRYPSLKVVILSAFNLFEYAQEALRMGATDYILKPFSPRDIASLLTYVRALAEAGTESGEGGALGEHAQNIVARWLVNPAQYAGAARKLLPLGKAGRAAVFAQCEAEPAARVRFSQAQPSLMRAASRLLNEALGTWYRCLVVGCPPAEGRFVALLFAAETPGAEDGERVERALEATLARLDAEFALPLGAACSDPVAEPHAQMHVAFRQADALCGFLFYLPAGRALFANMCLSPGKGAPPAEPLEALCAAIREGEVRAAESAADSLCALLAVPPFLSPFDLFSTLNLRLFAVLNELRGSISAAAFAQNSAALSALLNEPGRLAEFAPALRAVCAKIAAGAAAFRSDRGCVVIEQALEYLRAHLGDPTISQESVAEAFFFSPSHFSTLFKRHTGHTFTHYINMERITLAKGLLENPLYRVQDVAERVGFTDACYFARVFKKQTRLTPQEYRLRVCLPGGEGARHG